MAWKILNRLVTALVLVLGLLFPSFLQAQQIPVERQIQIQDVRLGFPAGSMDMYKEGKWVPVIVNVGPPKELNNLPADFQGSIEVVTKDSDGWNTHLLKDNVVVSKENSRGIFQSYIKVSDSTSFNGVQVRLRGKLGSTEINNLYSYPSPDKMRVGSRTSVDHDNLLVVNIGN